MPITVLIIEDNEQNMYMLSYLLTNQKYEVVKAYNGPDGIAAAVRTRPDIILLDIQLPEMDGYTVALNIRAVPELHSIPIIAVTSYAMPGDKEKALESGATGYIEKPINPDTFVAQMETFLPLTKIPKKEEAP